MLANVDYRDLVKHYYVHVQVEEMVSHAASMRQGSGLKLCRMSSCQDTLFLTLWLVALADLFSAGNAM